MTQLTQFEWVCVCPATSLKVFSPTRQEAIASMKVNLENYANTQAVHYVTSIGKNSDGVNCPEGVISLPGDIWICRLDKQICKLQAWIITSDKERFVNGCHAPNQRKEGIYQTVIKGEYEGAHHIAGRGICVTCSHGIFVTSKGKKPIKTHYHYDWELTSLSHFIDTDDYDFRATLIRNNIRISAAGQELCPDCIIQVVSIVSPELLDEFESIQLSFSI